MKTKFNIKPRLSINTFGRNRFFLGLVIAGCWVYVSYSFLFCFRETLKLFANTFSYPNWAWEIDPVNMTVNDFFLALIAFQIGQMVFFEFCFSKPTLKPFWDFKRKSILVDNRNLLPNVLFVGLKFSLAIALFLYPDMLALLTVGSIVFWVFFLLVLVIHLQAWQMLSRTFYKVNHWVGYSFLLMLTGSALLIQYHPIDYQNINQKQLNRIPDYALKINPPNINHNSLDAYFSYRYIPFSLQYINGKGLLADTYKTIDWKEIPSIIEKRKKGIPRYGHSKIFASVTIDENVPMEIVFKLKNYLRNNGVNRIAYTVLPTIPKDIQIYPYDRSYGILEKMNLICDREDLRKSLSYLKRAKSPEVFEYDIGCHPFSFNWEFIAIELRNKTTIFLNEKGEVVVENQLITQENLAEHFYQLFKEKKTVNLYFNINKKAKYLDYVQLKAIVQQAKKKVWEETSKQLFGMPYFEDLPTAYRIKIRQNHLYFEIEPNSELEAKIYKELERLGNEN